MASSGRTSRVDPPALVRAKSNPSERLEDKVSAELGDSFRSAPRPERAVRIARVVKLIACQKDPLVRLLLRAYVDYAASRLLRIYGGHVAERLDVDGIPSGPVHHFAILKRRFRARLGSTRSRRARQRRA
jgi:hypothetical protein